MRAISTVMLALILTAPVSAQELPSWLPPGILNSLTQQLAGRMKQLGLGPAKDEQKLLAGAQNMILAMAADLDGRGEDEIEKLAPTFTGFELPRAGQRELDLMVRYYMCNLPLFLQLKDPAFKDDLNARLTSTLGLAEITMVIGYLRQPFVTAGNDVKEIEAHLTDPNLEPIFIQVQKDPKLRAGVEKSCQPVISTLLEGPLKAVGGG